MFEKEIETINTIYKDYQRCDSIANALATLFPEDENVWIGTVSERLDYIMIKYFIKNVKDKKIKSKLKAFDKNGEELNYAMYDGDFTWDVPLGYTLKKVKV